LTNFVSIEGVLRPTTSEVYSVATVGTVEDK